MSCPYGSLSGARRDGQVGSKAAGRSHHAVATLLVDRHYHRYQLDVLSDGIVELGGFRNGQ